MKLKTAFYIYSDLSVAAFLAALSIVELICGAALIYLGVYSVAYLAFGGALFFIVISALMSLSVYKQIKAGE
jgi:hypothetical protein